MTPREPTILLAPIGLHRTQIEAAEATARDMERQNPAVPHVSRSWALRELIIWGCSALEEALAARSLTALRAPNPARGAPKRTRGTTATPTTDPEEFQMVPPTRVPRTLVVRLRSLVARVSRATGVRVTAATVVREVLLVGHEARERARAEAERVAREQRELLRASGFFDTSLVRAVGVAVVMPYTPPGRRSDTSGADSEWTGPRTLKPLAKNDAPEGSAKKYLRTATRKASRPNKKAVKTAAGRARTPRRRRASSSAQGASGDTDDEPGRPRKASTIVRISVPPECPVGACR